MKCQFCGKNTKRNSNAQKYCPECAIKIKKIYDKKVKRHKRWRKKYRNPLPDSSFPVNNEALLDKKNRYALNFYIPSRCPFCGCKDFDSDSFHGEIVCKKCGSVVEKMYTHM